MEGISRAFKPLPTTKRQNVCKMLYGWTNTGHQRIEIDTQAKSNCPHCPQENETQEHVITCSNGKVKACRYNALIALRTAITTKGGTSKTWDFLYESIRMWAKNDGADPHLSAERYGMTQDLKTTIQQAVQEQQVIGWNFALRGFLSTKWTAAYGFEHPHSTPEGIRDTWLKPIIRALWQFQSTMWDLRNQKLHSNDQDSSTITTSSLDSKIRKIYSLQDEFAAADQSLFDTSIEHRLQGSNRAKQHWLTLVAHYHPTTRDRKRGSQEVMTKYYIRHQRQEKKNRKHQAITLQQIGQTQQLKRQTKINWNKPP